jgi:hypothetical protein
MVGGRGSGVVGMLHVGVQCILGSERLAADVARKLFRLLRQPATTNDTFFLIYIKLNIIHVSVEILTF